MSEQEKFSDAEVFINFFGVIDDNELIRFLKEKATGAFTALGYAEKDFTRVIDSIEDEETKLYYKLIWDAKNLFDPIQNQFSEDEKFLLRFLRHRHCHPTLGGFSVKIEGKGENVKFKTAEWEQLVRLSKIMTVVDFKSSLFQRLIPYKGTLSQVAKLLTPSGCERLFRE